MEANRRGSRSRAGNHRDHRSHEQAARRRQRPTSGDGPRPRWPWWPRIALRKRQGLRFPRRDQLVRQLRTHAHGVRRGKRRGPRRSGSVTHQARSALDAHRENKKLPQLAKLASYGPKIVKHGMCQEVVHTDDASLFDLPIVQCWPHDGEPGFGGKPADYREGTGRYITFSAVQAKDPETGVYNLGMYRVQVFEERLAAAHWHVHHDGARIFRKYQKRGEKMPMACVFGGESILPFASTCPLPPDVSELLFAGFLNDGGIELVPCKTIPLEVPANAEFVIEGWVDPQQKLIEGPFGDHTGFYSAADWYPAYHITAITHRKEPIYPTTVVGKPPQEDYYLGKATERIFLPLLQMLIPDIIDYSLPMFGAFHNCVFVKIRKE
ncbi:MAG: UbiD family decarboxylase, partial [Planctomycetes bacterium]|nr:UbiD family decarboxylase [Planctomycetota bacterium]